MKHIEIGGFDIHLSETCRKCHGTGSPMDDSWKKPDETCEGCDGTGDELTDAGRTIIDLIIKHTTAIAKE